MAHGIENDSGGFGDWIKVRAHPRRLVNPFDDWWGRVGIIITIFRYTRNLSLIGRHWHDVMRGGGVAVDLPHLISTFLSAVISIWLWPFVNYDLYAGPLAHLFALTNK